MRKHEYDDYNAVYEDCCLNCLKEGSYRCSLVIEDGKCINFETVKVGDKVIFVSGGY